MTATAFTAESYPVPTSRPRLVTPALLLRFVTMLGASLSFYLLLSVVPLYAKTAAGGGAAGLATAALMAATVAGELVTPRLAARYGYRLTLAAGLILLGAPALALTAPANLAMITAVCVVRGFGFAIMVVAGGSLTAALIPAERRGEGLALAGLANGVPSLAALPAGVWLARQFGYAPVCTAGALVALVALVAVPGLPGREQAATRPAGGPQAGQPLGVVAALRTPALLRPGLVFAATTTAAGILVTFLPLTLTGASGGLIALVLFAQAAAATVTRTLCGRFGDRAGHSRLVIPALVTTVAGMGLLALAGMPAAALAGSLVFGAGFGVAQNATLSMMYARVPASSYPAVSAVWNIAYDAGMGLGAAGFGLLAGGTGYPAAFVITAAAMLAALAPARRDRRTSRSAGQG